MITIVCAVPKGHGDILKDRNNAKGEGYPGNHKKKSDIDTRAMAGVYAGPQTMNAENKQEENEPMSEDMSARCRMVYAGPTVKQNTTMIGKISSFFNKGMSGGTSFEAQPKKTEHHAPVTCPLCGYKNCVSKFCPECGAIIEVKNC